MPDQVEVLLTIFGVALCLGGWVIFLLGTRLIGIALGFGFGFGFGYLLALALRLEPDIASLVQFGCALLGAFGGLLLMKAATNFTFGAVGFLFGALIGRLGSEFWLQTRGEPFSFNQQTIMMILAGAVAVGLIAVMLQKLIMIVVTSFIGATFTAAGVTYLEERRPMSIMILFAVAVLWQAILAARLIPGGGRPRKERAPSQ